MATRSAKARRVSLLSAHAEIEAEGRKARRMSAQARLNEEPHAGTPRRRASMLPCIHTPALAACPKEGVIAVGMGPATVTDTPARATAFGRRTSPWRQQERDARVSTRPCSHR